MSWSTRIHWPSVAIASLALFAALGGTVYAAKKIDGRTIKVKSIPGNRLALKSIPGNRLKPGAISGNRIAPGSITGNQIDAATLGQVPSAVHAESAATARDAETALHAVHAVDAAKVNGYAAGCVEGTRAFAGGCWEEKAGEATLTAPAAALACASRGGELPDPLALAAFGQQPGVFLESEEWTGDIVSFTGVDAYSVATITSEGKVGGSVPSAAKQFRCVFPLVR